MAGCGPSANRDELKQERTVRHGGRHFRGTRGGGGVLGK